MFARDYCPDSSHLLFSTKRSCFNQANLPLWPVKGTELLPVGKLPPGASHPISGCESRGCCRQKEARWYISTNAFAGVLNILRSLQLSFYSGITQKGNIDSRFSNENKEMSWEKETLTLAMGAFPPVPSLSYQLTA